MGIGFIGFVRGLAPATSYRRIIAAGRVVAPAADAGVRAAGPVAGTAADAGICAAGGVVLAAADAGIGPAGGVALAAADRGLLPDRAGDPVAGGIGVSAQDG